MTGLTNFRVLKIAWVLLFLLSLSLGFPKGIREYEFCDRFECIPLDSYADYSFPRSEPKTLDPLLFRHLYPLGNHHFGSLTRKNITARTLSPKEHYDSLELSLECLDMKHSNEIVVMKDVIVQGGGLIHTKKPTKLLWDENILNLHTWSMWTRPLNGTVPEELTFDSAIMVDGRFTPNYFHFLVEAFPRVLLARKVLDLTGVPILCNKNEFIEQFFELLDISPEQIITPDERGVQVDTLYYPSTLPMDLPSKDRMLLVKSLMETLFPPTAEENQQDTLLYISRENLLRDVPRDEEEYLLQTLRSSFPNFNLTVFLGTESIEETVRLFRRAKIVLGAHGAGMSNMIFCQENTIVAEVLHTSNPVFLYWHLSKVLNLDYWLIPAVGHSSWRDEQFSLPIPEIVNILAKALSIPIDSMQCNAGMVGTINGCQKCPKGFVSKPGSNYCEICRPDTYANDRQTRCLPCPEHSHTQVLGKNFFDPTSKSATALPAFGASNLEQCLFEPDNLHLSKRQQIDEYLSSTPSVTPPPSVSVSSSPPPSPSATSSVSASIPASESPSTSPISVSPSSSAQPSSPVPTPSVTPSPQSSSPTPAADTTPTPFALPSVNIIAGTPSESLSPSSSPPTVFPTPLPTRSRVPDVSAALVPTETGHVQPASSDSAIIEFLVASCGDQCSQDEVDRFLDDVAEDFNVPRDQVRAISTRDNHVTVLICDSTEIDDNLNEFEENPSGSAMGDQVSVVFVDFNVDCGGYGEEPLSSTGTSLSTWSSLVLIPILSFLFSLSLLT